MQIKGIILPAITLAAVNAVPVTDASPATVASSYDYCMTIAYDAPQGLAYYRVAEDSEAAVKSICETCIEKTKVCNGNEACSRTKFDACTKDFA